MGFSDISKKVFWATVPPLTLLTASSPIINEDVKSPRENLNAVGPALVKGVKALGNAPGLIDKKLRAMSCGDEALLYSDHLCRVSNIEKIESVETFVNKYPLAKKSLFELEAMKHPVLDNFFKVSNGADVNNLSEIREYLEKMTNDKKLLPYQNIDIGKVGLDHIVQSLNQGSPDGKIKYVPKIEFLEALLHTFPDDKDIESKKEFISKNGRKTLIDFTGMESFDLLFDRFHNGQKNIPGLERKIIIYESNLEAYKLNSEGNLAPWLLPLQFSSGLVELFDNNDINITGSDVKPINDYGSSDEQGKRDQRYFIQQIFVPTSLTND